MKKILFFLGCILAPFLLKAQEPQPVYGDYVYPGSVLFDNGLYVPVRDTVGFAPYRVGALVILPQDTVGHPAAPPIRFWNGSYWGSIVGGSGNIYFGSNGLLLIGNTFKLGGSLTQNTDITTGSFGFTLNGATKASPTFRLTASGQQLGFREIDSTLSGFDYSPDGKKGIFSFYAGGVPVGILRQGSLQLNDSLLNNYLYVDKDQFTLTGPAEAAYAQIAPGNTTLSTTGGSPYAVFNSGFAQLPPYANSDSAKYLTVDNTGKLVLKVPAGIRAIDSAIADLPTGNLLFRYTNGQYLPVFIGKPVDSLWLSNDTLKGRLTSGGDLAIKVTGLPQENIIGLADSLKLFTRIDSVYTFSGWQLSYNGYHAAEGALLNLGGDTLINIFRLDTAMEHAAGKGQIVKRYSYDGGLTWTSATVVYDSPQDDRNIIAGITPTGRIVVVFRRYTGSSTDDRDVVSIYSDNRGSTWSSPFAFTITLPTVALPFGPVLVAGDNALHCVIHAGAGGADMYKSTDNGATWTRQAGMYTGGETWWAYIGDDKIIALSRDEATVDSAYRQQVSSDNGNTWTYAGRTLFNNNRTSYNKTAPFITYDTVRGGLVAISYTRNQSTSSPFLPRNDSFYIYQGNPDSIFSSPVKWRLTHNIERPLSNQLLTYGYPAAVQLKNGDYIGLITENGTMGYGDTGFGQERAMLYQFDFRWMNTKSRYPGLTISPNPFTHGVDNLSTQADIYQPDSTSVFQKTAALWVGALRNSTRDPFAVVDANNARLLSVSTAGTVTATKLIGSTELFSDSSNTTASTAWAKRNTILDQTDFPQSANYRIDGTGTAKTFNAVGGGAFRELFSYRNTSNANRWAMGYDSIAETGSGNTGGNLEIWRYADNGTNLGYAINVHRATGRVSFGTVNDPGSNTGKFAVIGIGTTGGELMYRTQAEMLSDLSAAPSSGSSSYIQQQFSSDQSGSFRINGTGKMATLITDGAVNSNHHTIRVGNSNRWNFSITGTESGSNAGSDLAIYNYTDAGSLISSTSFLLKRSNGFLGLGISPTERLHVSGNAIITGTLQVGGVKWITGTGTPEGSVTAPAGSLYTNTSGSAGTTLYVKESGSGNTGWIAK